MKMIPARFELVLTADKSPSFQRMDDLNQELMHHRGGAYSETQYIYGDAIRIALKNGLKSFVSVGLGLGYNELLIACENLKMEAVAGIEPGSTTIISYELVDQLKSDFLAFIHRDPSAPTVYSDILAFFTAEYGFSDEQILSWLQEAFVSGRWQLQGALTSDAKILRKSECCLFDAFSSKTSPDLWSEEFLKMFLNEHFTEKALFATYASLGSLKRSLLSAGFHLGDKSGFAGRRESTLAFRGNFNL